MNRGKKKIGGIGATISTLGMMSFYFLLGRKDYCVSLNIVTGETPLIF